MEGAMGGACSIDGDWDSICRMLSMDQYSDFGNLLEHSSNNYDQLLEDDDEGSVISLLMAGDTTPNYFHVDLHSLPHMSSISNSSNYDPIISSFSTINDPMNIINAGELKTEDEFAPLQPKKRARIPKDHGLKGKRKARAKKVRDVDEAVGEEEDNKKSTNRNAASDDEPINNSQEGIKVKSDDTGKKRAGRGAATNPQSLYARKRRERINERLRILQTLVPNGTKVDISTMLEEAVHYVKFLQTQIKLLSSDEMWMYAPLAYNGIDVGLYNNFSAYVLP